MYISKRVPPTTEHCDPRVNACRKGDWISSHIADCSYQGPISCNAQHDTSTWSWIVDVEEEDRCTPVQGLQFNCGAAGSNTRCVCSDTNPLSLTLNACRCQYWPAEDPGIHSPASCVAYYQGGELSVHHWACCNNCNDVTNQHCDGATWHGGSGESYCSYCGENTGGGRVLYYFNCGSCTDQRRCEEHCNGPISNLPGLCWMWLECFKSCCLQSTPQPLRSKRQIDN